MSNSGNIVELGADYAKNNYSLLNNLLSRSTVVRWNAKQV